MKSWLQIGNSDLEFKRKGEPIEISISTTLVRPGTNGRHRRQAIIYDGSETFHDHNSHFHPPKPPKLEDTTRKYKLGNLEIQCTHFGKKHQQCKVLFHFRLKTYVSL